MPAYYFKCILTFIVSLNLSLPPFINNFWNSAYTPNRAHSWQSTFFPDTVLDDPDYLLSKDPLPTPAIHKIRKPISWAPGGLSL